MTGYDLTDAVEAAWEVLDEDGHNGLDCRPDVPTTATAERAVRAALPHLEQQIRERVAAEIEVHASDYRDAEDFPAPAQPTQTYDLSYLAALKRAATIARGERP